MGETKRHQKLIRKDRKRTNITYFEEKDIESGDKTRHIESNR